MGLLDARQLDPEGTEPAELLQATDFSAARVLEIGTGNGRLALRYCHVTRALFAVEPEGSRLPELARVVPAEGKKMPKFLCGDAMALPFPRRVFDIAVLAWSL